MKCAGCQHVNPPDAHFCASCGVRVVEYTGDHAAIAGLVNESPDDQTTSDAATFDTGVLPAGNPLAATVPGGDGTNVSEPHDPLAAPRLIARRSPSLVPIVMTVAVVIAIVVIGAVLVLSDGENGRVAPVTIDEAAVSTEVLPTPAAAAPTDAVPATEPPAAATVPAAAPATPETVATTPSPTATPPTTEPQPPEAGPPPDPWAVPPVPPEPGPIDAPGSPQVLAEVSPSGLPYAATAAAFTIAQEFGDALALEDWDAARALSPGVAGFSDADFVDGYDNTNRVSLMLLDARPAGSEVELLVVSVAVELGGIRTSLYCLQWSVDASSRTIRQVGGSRIAEWQANAQPEAIRNDADALATVRQCGWP